MSFEKSKLTSAFLLTNIVKLTFPYGAWLIKRFGISTVSLVIFNDGISTTFSSTVNVLIFAVYGTSNWSLGALPKAYENLSSGA